MKSIFRIVALLCLVSACAFGTVNVSGSIKDPSGTVVPNSFVRFELTNTNNGQCSVSGASIGKRTADFTADNTTGAVSGTLYRNDTEVSCGGSFNTRYNMTIYRKGVPDGPSKCVNVTANFDISNPQYCVTPPPVANPAQYVTTTANNAFTGNNAFSGNNAFTGTNTHTGTETFNGSETHTGAATHSGTETFKLAPVGIASAGGYNAFGDSITCGTAANNTTSTCSLLGYANIVAPYLGGTFTNYGTSGAQACDLGRLQIYPNTNPQDSGNATATMMAGTNDVNSRGTVPNHPLSYQACMMANITWLTIPRSAKLFGQDAAVTKTGTWSNDNTLLSGLGTQSTTNGDSLSFSVTTTGGPIFIGYRVIDSNGGTASVTIDGVSQGTLNAFGYDAINTINGVTDSVFVNRFPVSAGTHSVSLTVTSATGAGNIFSFLWAGTPVAPHGFGFPRLFQLGVTREQTGTNDTLTAAYDGYISTLATQLFNDGLWVNFVPVHTILDVSADFFNQSHPNLGGHQKLAYALLGVAQPAGGGGSASVFPATITTAEDMATTFAGSSAAINGIDPGLLNFKSIGNPGNAAGRAYSKFADGLNYIVDFQPTGWGGWKRCTYTSGTALSSATQLTPCLTTTPTTVTTTASTLTLSGATSVSVPQAFSVTGTTTLAGLQTTGSPNPVTAGSIAIGTSVSPWSGIHIGSSGTARSFLATLATSARAQNLPDIAGTLTMDIGSGTATMGTGAIAAGTCATAVTVASANVLATDSIAWSFNAAPGTGYTAGLHVLPYVTAGNVNFLVCNPSAGSLTPAAATLNWKVTR